MFRGLTFGITYFNIVLNLHNIWFWWIGMGPHGWQVGFHQNPAVAQPTVSWFMLFVSFSDVHCLHALWSKTSSVRYASRIIL